MAKRQTSIDRSADASGGAGTRMPIAGPVTDDPTPDSPLLPHEHDESPEVAPGPRPTRIKQGQRDLAQGRVDTEARSDAVRHFERAVQDRATAHSVRDRRGRKDQRT
jgi:hypothetical protein